MVRVLQRAEARSVTSSRKLFRGYLNELKLYRFSMNFQVFDIQKL